MKSKLSGRFLKMTCLSLNHVSREFVFLEREKRKDAMSQKLDPEGSTKLSHFYSRPREEENRTSRVAD